MTNTEIYLSIVIAICFIAFIVEVATSRHRLKIINKYEVLTGRQEEFIKKQHEAYQQLSEDFIRHVAEEYDSMYSSQKQHQ